MKKSSSGNKKKKIFVFFTKIGLFFSSNKENITENVSIFSGNKQEGITENIPIRNRSVLLIVDGTVLHSRHNPLPSPESCNI